MKALKVIGVSLFFGAILGAVPWVWVIVLKFLSSIALNYGPVYAFSLSGLVIGLVVGACAGVAAANEEQR